MLLPNRELSRERGRKVRRRKTLGTKM